jgi:putrescine importer
MSSETKIDASAVPRLRRTLTVWDLVFYGLIVIQPTAPMPLFGVVSQEARGHVVTAILIAMVAMLLTAVSYGRMARVYPSAGSAYAYVRGEFGNFAGFLTGWGIVLDYLLNPLICTIWCSKATANILPIPYPILVVFFAGLFTLLNLRGIQASAATNRWLAIAMSVVVVYMLICMLRYLAGVGSVSAGFLMKPFYDPANFSLPHVLTGTSIAALTYIGFDSISTLSEEVVDPRRNILRATVFTCLLTGLFSAIEVYLGQLVWPDFRHFPDVDTAYSFVAGRAGGLILFHIVNATLLIATIGSGIGSQLGAARLLYGMGRDNALPSAFFGHLNQKTKAPDYNVLFSGVIALIGAMSISYQLGAELLNFGAFLSFTGVNAATFMHYFVRGRNRRWTYLVLPLAGCAVCLYIWFSLRWQARLVGFSWLCAGTAYALIRRRELAKSPAN